ncbi:TPA: DUF4148 domain-containing protein [Burkholderia vietnamiensis]|uniref:DUF4148 domain-containing protein n=1 Tax=Burkholderia vietnamiensis TaxID=60552 RepID=UPI0033127F97|nr:DUF4148 domain-containing protein [Burkholderia vietnamiensis]
MLETWIQWSCDGCEATEMWHDPNVTRAQVRAELRKGGWRSYGVLDYCPKCIERGIHRTRSSAFVLAD